MRGLLSASVLVAGSEHLYLWAVRFHRIHVVGALFVLDFAASLVIAIVAVATRRIVGPLLAAGFAASTLGAFFYSVLFGINGYHEALLGTGQEIAGVAEVVALFLAVSLLIAPFARAVSARQKGRRRADRAGPEAGLTAP